MDVSPILDSMGRQTYLAGGEDAYAIHKYKGLVVSLEWGPQEGKKRGNAYMVIWRDRPQRNVFTPSEHNGKWAICRAVITEFVGFNREGKCTGSGSIALYREALASLPELGFDRYDKQAFLALVDAVIRFAPDLHHMPVTPKSVVKKWREAAEPTWEMTAADRNTGRVITEGAI